MLLAENNINTIARRICLVFLALWIGLYILSFMNPYGLYPVSIDVYFLILLFIISFTLGITFSYNKTYLHLNNDSTSKIKSNIDTFVDSKYIIFIAIFCDLFLLYAFSKQQVALLDSSIQDLRLEGSQDYLFGNNGILGSLYNLFVIPFSSILHVLFAYILACRRNSIIALIVCLVNVFLSTAVNNSRGVLMTVIIYVIFVICCCPFLLNKESKIKRLRNIIILVFFSIISFAFVAYLTAQRLFGTNEISGEAIEMGIDGLNKHIITYFVAPFRCFQYALENNYFNTLGGPTLGRSTFGFLDGFIGFVVKHLGLHYTTSNDIIYSQLQEKWIWVGVDMNFAYTSLFNYYMDFGFVGIAILPYFFGAIIKKICNIFLRNGNPALFFLLGYLFLALWECYFGWILYRWAVAFYFILIFILYLYFRGKKMNNVVGKRLDPIDRPTT